MKLDDKESCRILIIESVSTIRQMMTDIFKNFGFQNVQAMSKAEDGFHYLETESVDWLILPSLLQQPINCLHFLDLITKHPNLRQIKTSLIIDEESESKYLSRCFELGLMSFHPKAYIKENIIDEFESFFSIYKARHRNEILTAADYLRKFLSTNPDKQNRLIFEQNLLDLFPGTPHCLLSLAEAQFESNQKDDCLETLDQVLLIQPKFAPLVSRAKKRFGFSEDQEPSGDRPKKSNCLHLKQCVIIDPDTDNLYAIRTALVELGVLDIECYEDGEEAFFEMASRPEPSLIVCEWKIPSLSGPMFVQRIRNHGFINCPIVVSSSLLNQSELPLANEIGVDAIIEKPFEKTDLYKSLIWTVQQNRKPNEQRSYELKIRRLLKAQKFEDALHILKQYKSDERISQTDFEAMKAEFYYASEDYDKSYSYCISVLKKVPDHLYALNALGNILLRRGDFKHALKCFDRADKIAPKNLERLLNIALVHKESGNEDEATSTLEQVEELDPNSEFAQLKTSGMHLEMGHIEAAKSQLAELTVTDQFARDMNNRAVALALQGQFEKSTKLYRDTLTVVSEDETDILESVRYNLCLSLVKYGEMQEAQNELSKFEKDLLDDSSLHKKIKKLIDAVDRAVASGVTLKLSSSEEKTDETTGEEADTLELGLEESSDKFDLEDDELDQLVEAARGDICCHLIYIDIKGANSDSQEAAADPPKYRKREKIEKAG